MPANTPSATTPKDTSFVTDTLIAQDIDAYLTKHQHKTMLRFITCGSVDDDRFPLASGQVPEMRSVRFRTLGCYPLSGAVESTATTLPEVIQEMLLTTTSERQGRAIDHDQAASMEKKKQEGYF